MESPHLRDACREPPIPALPRFVTTGRDDPPVVAPLPEVSIRYPVGLTFSGNPQKSPRTSMARQLPTRIQRTTITTGDRDDRTDPQAVRPARPSRPQRSARHRGGDHVRDPTGHRR